MSMKRKIKLPVINFDITVDGAPVNVVAVPYITANEKKRFRVSYNGSPIHILELNESVRKIEVVDSASETIPVNLERAIGHGLLHKIAA